MPIPYKTHRGILCIDQLKANEFWNGTQKFKKGDPHPTIKGLFYFNVTCKRPRWGSEEDLEKARERTRKWRQDNPEKAREIVRKWHRDNREKSRESVRKWRQDNPEKVRAKDSKRRGALKTNIKLHRSAQDALQGVYELRECLTLCARGAGSSEAFHVDHIWPIQGEGFCGLHAPWNLQVLEASENISKSNKTPTI